MRKLKYKPAFLSATGQKENPLNDHILKRVILVGALIRHYGEDSESIDLTSLVAVLEFQEDIDIAFGDAEIFVSNGKYGHDFIRNAPEADAVFLNWINYTAIGGHFVSPLLGRKGYSWKSALERSNPKFIVNVTDNDTCVPNTEIPERYCLIHHESDSINYVYKREDLELAL